MPSQRQVEKLKRLRECRNSLLHGKGESDKTTGRPTYEMLAKCCGYKSISKFKKSEQYEWWKGLDALTKKEDKHLYIHRTLVPHLQKKNARLATVAIDYEAKEQIIKKDFVPCLVTHSNPNLGLGPLTFCTRSQASVQFAERQRQLNAEAKNTNAEDIKRAKTKTPRLPAGWVNCIDAIEVMQATFQFLFSKRCKAVPKLRKLVKAMSATRQLLLTDDTTSKWIPQVLWEVATALEAFFESTKMDGKVIMDLEPIIDQIKARKATQGEDLTQAY